MSDTIERQQDAGIRTLGGEAGHRGLFAIASRGRAWGIIVTVIVGMTLTPYLKLGAILGTLAVVGLIVILTAGTHNGSIVDRRRRKSRWKQRQKTGTDHFIPYDAARWELLTKALTDTAKKKRGESRAERRKVVQARVDWHRELVAMRPNPDGADGMGWLQSTAGMPGIAWHGPVGETPYLSVAFSVLGQLRGMESSRAVVDGADAWSLFLAARATPSSLVRSFQPLTRVLPADTALQEFWVLNNLDPDAPADAVASYAQVLERTGADSMVQRHFIVARWPITPDFVAFARKFGEGRDGWRALMAREIDSIKRGLDEARFGSPEALTARGLTAAIRHMQNPSRPLDFVADLTPAETGERSHDDYSAHIVDGTDPDTGDSVRWHHRTAVVRGQQLAVAERAPLWLLDLLIGEKLRMTRTVSFHIEGVPAAEARPQATRDFVSDQAQKIGKEGKLDDDGIDTRASAAARRREDLKHGSPHHGATWIGYITITAENIEDLAAASRELGEVCSDSAGIERLEWLDSYQSSASGTTWPIARGLAPSKPTFAARAMRTLAGRGDKEAIA